MYIPPSLQDVLQPMLDEYSAQEFVRKLAQSIEQAKLTLEQDRECLLEVILHNGDVIRASRISAEGTNALRIEGTRNNETCLMFCNHASLQLVCTFPIREANKNRPKIGFYVAGEEVSPGAR